MGLNISGRFLWIYYLSKHGKKPIPNSGWAGNLLYTLDPQILQKALIGEPYLGLANYVIFSYP